MMRGGPNNAPPPTPVMRFEAARDFGDVWTLTELWNSLGFDRLRQVFRRTRHSIDVEALIRVMVLNRLCDPDSKLGVLRWLQTVSLPGVTLESVDHQHLLRAMDVLVDHKEEVDGVMSGLLRPLVDQDLAVVFYDMTTIRAAGLPPPRAHRSLLRRAGTELAPACGRDGNGAGCFGGEVRGGQSRDRGGECRC